MRGSGRSALRLVRCALVGAVFVCAAVSRAAAQDDARSPAATAPPPAVAPAPLADPRTVTDQAPGSAPLTVTLGNGFINQRLPFDIPFYVSGSVESAAATRVDLFVYRLQRSTGASAFVTQLQSTYTCEAEGGVQPFSRSRSPVGAARMFTLLVDPLDPQRYYVFCFIAAGAVPLTEIEVAVRNIFADTVTALVPQDPGDVSLPLGMSIHRRLREEIARVGERRNVPAVIPEGNIFRDETQVAPGTRFASLLIDLINAYRDASELSSPYTQYHDFRNVVRQQVAAAQKTAGDLINQGLVDALPLDAALPSPRTAFVSTMPLALNVPPFNVDGATTALGAAVAAANAKGAAEAAMTLEGLVAGVRTLGELARIYARAYERLSAAAGSAIEYVELEAREVTVNLGSTVLTADLSRNAYVSLDAGIAYPWRLENMVFYAGTNIYFRPINKDAPLRDKGTFFHRFALTIGVTTTVNDDSRRALDLRPTEDETETSNSLLIGGGLRVTSSMRLGAGALVFRERHSNPLIDQTSVRVTPYVSLAVDVNVAEVLQSFFP